ncbi:Helix-turn-helix domain-containing protein [Amycolatopsis tolypomycina]|uniref:Helix-turn-helix domain-containing protein n=1 Tax=Amycolatopsis tolypomycina TaxID=208445 RepID=A0A1H4JHI3_9PSEU|nr:helix-turn-helix transcriptional regulator [Amycolatopsis tolypomycina]SEB45774.1 Helix-turn-helix domain-containing protein [Amycolatopsis tolypomycina]
MTEPSSRVTPGQVLQAWRAYRDVSGAEVARRIGVQPPALSQWETGKRTPEHPYAVTAIGKALQLPADEATAMEGMWRTAASVTALPPQGAWFHNFPIPSGPVWAWMRSHPGSGDHQVVLEFGPFNESFTIPADSGGLIVHSPTSLPNPPLKVIFDGEGWTDFGRGVIPEQVATKLGITMIAARDVIGGNSPMFRPLKDDESAESRTMLANIRHAASWFNLAWSRVSAHFGVLRPTVPTARALEAETIATTRRPGTSVTDTAGQLVSQLMMTPEQIRAIRQARGFTRAEAAQEATNRNPRSPVTPKMLETLETTGRIPAAAHALARLDMIYQTDGRLGIDRVEDFDTATRTPTGAFSPDFPWYWQGHVWLQVHGPRPDDTCVMELIWGPWRRRVRVRSLDVVTTRKAVLGPDPARPAPPPPHRPGRRKPLELNPRLVVTLPRGWRLGAGMGAVPTALDINVGWRPVNLRAAAELVRESVRAIELTRPRSPDRK